MWGESTYPFLTFNSATVEVSELVSDLSHTYLGMWSLIHAEIKVNYVGKRGNRWIILPLKLCLCKIKKMRKSSYFLWILGYTVYPKKYAHGFCFAVLCCGYTLTDFPISIRLTALALWQSNDCPSASKATLMNMDKYFMWIHYERLHNHNKAKHNKTVCIFLGIYCTSVTDVNIK